MTILPRFFYRVFRFTHLVCLAEVDSLVDVMLLTTLFVSENSKNNGGANLTLQLSKYLELKIIGIFWRGLIRCQSHVLLFVCFHKNYDLIYKVFFERKGRFVLGLLQN